MIIMLQSVLVSNGNEKHNSSEKDWLEKQYQGVAVRCLMFVFKYKPLRGQRRTRYALNFTECLKQDQRWEP